MERVLNGLLMHFVSIREPLRLHTIKFRVRSCLLRTPQLCFCGHQASACGNRCVPATIMAGTTCRIGDSQFSADRRIIRMRNPCLWIQLTSV